MIIHFFFLYVNINKTYNSYYKVKGGTKVLIFDFSDTEFMDSSGVGIILGRYKKITCFHGKVYAIHANMQIRKILHMSGLQKIIEILEEK